MDTPGAHIRLKVAIAAYYAAHHNGQLDRSHMKLVAYFAEHAVVRVPRTVHRWLDGQYPIPDVVQRAVERIVTTYTATELSNSTGVTDGTRTRNP